MSHKVEESATVYRRGAVTVEIGDSGVLVQGFQGLRFIVISPNGLPLFDGDDPATSLATTCGRGCVMLRGVDPRTRMLVDADWAIEEGELALCQLHQNRRAGESRLSRDRRRSLNVDALEDLVNDAWQLVQELDETIAARLRVPRVLRGPRGGQRADDWIYAHAGIVNHEARAAGEDPKAALAKNGYTRFTVREARKRGLVEDAPDGAPTARGRRVYATRAALTQ